MTLAELDKDPARGLRMKEGDPGPSRAVTRLFVVGGLSFLKNSSEGKVGDQHA